MIPRHTFIINSLTSCYLYNLPRVNNASGFSSYYVCKDGCIFILSSFFYLVYAHQIFQSIEIVSQ